MSEAGIHKELPIGTGGYELHKNQETLPVSEVANEVEWVNGKFRDSIPFLLEEGKSTRLGIFLNPRPHLGKDGKEVEVRHRHGRSGLLGRVIFADSEGKIYRDIDIKGLGYIESIIIRHTDLDKMREIRTPALQVGEVGSRLAGRAGIYELQKAHATKDMEEIFSSLGIRTTRTIAIVKLREIIDENGNTITIEEARKKHLINRDVVPVLAIRASLTKARVSDLRMFDNGSGAAPDARVLLDDARLIVASELGRDAKEFSTNDYLTWFAKSIGENLAKIHKAGYIHGVYGAGNIMLDSRVTDLDSVEKIPYWVVDKREYIKNQPDVHDAESCIGYLVGFALFGREAKGEEEKEVLKKYQRVMMLAYEEQLTIS